MTRLLTAALTLVIAVACAQRQPPPEAVSEPARVENAELGIALAELTGGFVVRTNDGASLELDRADESASGEAWFEIGPLEEAGVNLVDIVNGQRQQYEDLPGGTFSGSRELMMPDGRPAYYSRGQYDHDGQRVEEFRISALHPTQNRSMTIHYRYPAADDSSERLQDLLLLIGEIEAASVPATDSPE